MKCVYVGAPSWGVGLEGGGDFPTPFELATCDEPVNELAKLERALSDRLAGCFADTFFLDCFFDTFFF